MIFCESHRILKASEDRPLPLTVYNCKNHSLREVVLVPSKNWPGEGMLGVTIRFDTYFEAEEHLLHGWSFVLNLLLRIYQPDFIHMHSWRDWAQLSSGVGRTSTLLRLFIGHSRKGCMIPQSILCILTLFNLLLEGIQRSWCSLARAERERGQAGWVLCVQLGYGRGQGGGSAAHSELGRGGRKLRIRAIRCEHSAWLLALYSFEVLSNHWNVSHPGGDMFNLT